MKSTRGMVVVGAFAAMAATGCASVGRTGPAGSRPSNIVFIMADDLGYGDIGSFGQQKIHTPRLDEMARFVKVGRSRLRQLDRGPA